MQHDLVGDRNHQTLGEGEFAVCCRISDVRGNCVAVSSLVAAHIFGKRPLMQPRRFPAKREVNLTWPFFQWIKLTKSARNHKSHTVHMSSMPFLKISWAKREICDEYHISGNGGNYPGGSTKANIRCTIRRSYGQR